jgi:phosphoribosyl 1,2-cyclic phosphodiesterase
MLRWCCLGSGSEGNALVIEAGAGLFTTRVLVDCGFGPRTLERRLAAVALTLDDLDAVYVTHEHADHASGVAALLRRRPLPLLCSAGTRRAANLDDAAIDWRPLRAGQPVDLGEVELHPFAVLHDAVEPLQLVATDGDRRFGLLTDLGTPSGDVARALDGLHALQLECNHDADLLAGGAYPPFLKQRIAGDRGHLSNAQAAALLATIDCRRLHTVAAAHLSRSNNRPDLARAALGAALNGAATSVLVAEQDGGLGWIDV